MGRKASFLAEGQPASRTTSSSTPTSPSRARSRTARSCSRVPHRLIEGCLIAAHAIESKHVFIYIRGEYLREFEILATRSSRRAHAGLLGDVTIVIHRGAGAYICGEETALLESLEGKRGQPRSKPPFPAIAGPLRRRRRCQQRRDDRDRAADHRDAAAPSTRSSASENSTGTRVFSLSGNVVNGGNYELPLGHDAARADLRRRRRHPRRARAEGGHPRRLVGAGPDRRPDRHAARLRLDRRGRLDARLGRGDRRSTTAAAWCSSACGSRSSTCTSRAASARRAARARAGWCRSCRRSRTATRRRPTSTCCSTSATGSSASASARSATRPRCRSRATSTSSARSSSAHVDEGGCPFGGESSLEGILAPVDQHTPPRHGRGGARVSGAVPSGAELVTVTIDDREVEVAEGHGARRDRARGGDRDPRLLLRAAARAARRRLPHVPRRGRGPAEAPGRLHADRAGRDGRPHRGHLGEGGRGPERDARVHPRQPPARLPGLRQGRRVPAAGPDVPLRARARRG